MAASFDGTASTLETPFDNVTNEAHASAAVKAQIAKIPPQQTEWDTSNIVSGTSLTPANVEAMANSDRTRFRGLVAQRRGGRSLCP